VTGAASFLGNRKKYHFNASGPDQQSWRHRRHPIEVIIEDSKSDETQAVLSAKKLLETGQGPGNYRSSTTGESMALVPIMNGAKTPLISCAAGAGITQPVIERHWIFKTPPI